MSSLCALYKVFLILRGKVSCCTSDDCQRFEKSISLIIDKYIGGMDPSRKHTHDTFVETLFVTDI